ncbi:oligosaccharide flippase family protein [Hyphomicrobium sp.]|uniref:oligosaccharide flippase family protein n=1 Tax=Hyphomicrobium sp. TaxID=82 RepID=UPI002D77C3CD|nr:oligosaccharide flippase family protein [Hyphomicrobium sp.]HET6389430.1 oligosaccharide flippase family protein [Hyphomicrobium sp.]
MKSNTHRLLARNVFHLGIGQVASTAIGVLLAAVLGRALGPADFGTLYSILAITAFVCVAVDWGQTTYIVRETARGRSDEPELVGAALSFRLVTMVIGCAVAVAIAWALGYSDQVVMLTLLTMVVGLPAALYAPLGFLFRGKDRMDFDAFANIAGKALTLIATAIALYFGGGLTDVILMQGVGGITTLLLGVFCALQLGFPVKAPGMNVHREILVHGAPITAFSLVIASQPFVEIMMLSAFAGPAVVGWYGASRTIFGIVTSPATIMVTAFFPQLSRAALSLPDLRNMIAASARILFIVAALAASGLYLFADHAVAIIYGQGRFEHTAAILRVSAIFIPLLFFVLLLAAAISAVGRNKAMVGVSAVRIVFCVVLGWFLIGYGQEHYGNGAIVLVIIAGVAEIPAAIACCLLLPRSAVGRATILHLLRAYIAALCTVLPLSPVEPLPLWGLVPLYALVFAIAAMATRLVLPSDLQHAWDIVRSFWPAEVKSPADARHQSAQRTSDGAGPVEAIRPSSLG